MGLMDGIKDALKDKTLGKEWMATAPLKPDSLNGQKIFKLDSDNNLEMWEDGGFAGVGRDKAGGTLVKMGTDGKWIPATEDDLKAGVDYQNLQANYGLWDDKEFKDSFFSSKKGENDGIIDSKEVARLADIFDNRESFSGGGTYVDTSGLTGKDFSSISSSTKYYQNVMDAYIGGDNGNYAFQVKWKVTDKSTSTYVSPGISSST